jgi:hypothetical protein
VREKIKCVMHRTCWILMRQSQHVTPRHKISVFRVDDPTAPLASRQIFSSVPLRPTTARQMQCLRRGGQRPMTALDKGRFAQLSLCCMLPSCLLVGRQRWMSMAAGAGRLPHRTRIAPWSWGAGGKVGNQTHAGCFMQILGSRRQGRVWRCGPRGQSTRTCHPSQAMEWVTLTIVSSQWSGA